MRYSLDGTPAGASIDPSSGAFAWAPDNNQTGNYTFSVVVADDGGNADRVRGNLSARTNMAVTVDNPPLIFAFGPILPFNSTNVGQLPIYYLLSGVKDGNVSVKIVDKSTGMAVRTISIPGVKSTGIHSVTWDGRSDSGAFVPEGYYDVKVVLGMPALPGTTVCSQYNIHVDNTLPVISISTPSDGAVYAIGQAVYAKWNASDSLSRVAYASGTVGNGGLIDTSTAGYKSFTVTAKDIAGNKTTKTILYYVQTYHKKMITVGRAAPIKGRLAVRERRCSE